MLCKTCNTRFHDRATICPNCGWHPPGHRPRGADETAPTALAPLPTEDDPETVAPWMAAAHPPEPRGHAAEPIPEPEEAPLPAEPRPMARPASGSPASLVAPDPHALRVMLADRPDLIEAGLEVLRDDAGNPIGASYATGVGDIDLLARDRNGGLVVVLVSAAANGDTLVPETLQRIGWVRKHLGRGGTKVRGIVLVASLPENLRYAAAAVADTVSFKSWRVALTFTDLEV